MIKGGMLRGLGVAGGGRLDLEKIGKFFLRSVKIEKLYLVRKSVRPGLSAIEKRHPPAKSRRS